VEERTSEQDTQANGQHIMVVKRPIWRINRLRVPMLQFCFSQGDTSGAIGTAVILLSKQLGLDGVFTVRRQKVIVFTSGCAVLRQYYWFYSFSNQPHFLRVSAVI
jgi:hypothetical protein